MISKAQSLPDNFFYPLEFTASARAGWKHLLTYFSIKAPFSILLPPYIGITDREGSGIFDPVTETETPYGFYKLDEQLAVDLVDLEELFRTRKYKVILLAHYFGFCRTNLKAIMALCKFYEVILVEDCAHALGLHQPDILMGNVGDFALYSLHKFLPFSKGGILKNNNKNWLLDKLPQDLQLEEIWVNKFSSYDLGKIIQKRKSNYRFLQLSLTGLEGLTIMYDLKEGDVPHDFPILIDNGLREKLYFQLMEWDVPTTALYYRLIDPLQKPDFEDMRDISANILNLPIHQDLDRKDLEDMVNKLVKALKLLS